MITKEELSGLFADMRKNAPWDSNGPLTWAYFFADPAKARLEQVAPLLKKQGYRQVGIYLSDKDQPGDPDLWWLQVEKVEQHTVDTLHARNEKFYAFAAEHGLESYDGMDVGPA